MIPKRLLAEIRKKSNKVFLLSAHIHLEGDALGSELALASLLKRLGKKVIVYDEDAPPSEYNFLPGIEGVVTKDPGIDYDVAIFVDCSDCSRVGKVHKALNSKKLLMNIDHHVSNSFFGDVNWVEGGASSACEMIYELFQAFKVKINKKEAILLYTGMMTDTGGFKFANTTSRTHEAAASLLKSGLDVYRIHRRIYETMSFETVKCYGKIIQSLKTDPSGKVAWLEIPYSLLSKSDVLAQQTDAIIHFARCIEGVEVALLFKEIHRAQEVRVNFRSTGIVDVNKIAAVFGGGGHKMASGATLKGNFKNIIARVVEESAKRSV
ncbi:MAG: bifunctional oligoribonuclease/PAP phosphatase NrnA [Candidatus Omnitrophota bacterium]